MKIDFDAIECVEQAGFKGGEGSVSMRAFDDGDNKIMLVAVHPASSVGWHQHVGNSEIIRVLSGEGKAIVEGGEEPLSSGVVHYCPRGAFHSVVNTGSEDLVMYAIVGRHD